MSADSESNAMRECDEQWDRIPAAMRSVMDRSTWSLAWQLAWAGGMKEMQTHQSTVTQELVDALRANGVFHTPVMLRRVGGSWNEYESDAINRTRDAIAKYGTEIYETKS